MTREEMMIKVIKARGFEERWTIWFAKLVENKKVSNRILQDAMIAAIAMPFEDDEDEDE